MAPPNRAPVLRMILTGSLIPAPDKYDEARAYTKRILGPAASSIAWKTAALPGAHNHGITVDYGVMTDPSGYQLYVIFDVSEPGTERLTVRVPCDRDPDCRWAYDDAGSTTDLLAVLDGGTETEGNIHCYQHDPYF